MTNCGNNPTHLFAATRLRILPVAGVDTGNEHALLGLRALLHKMQVHRHTIKVHRAAASRALVGLNPRHPVGSLCGLCCRCLRAAGATSGCAVLRTPFRLLAFCVCRRRFHRGQWAAHRADTFASWAPPQKARVLQPSRDGELNKGG